MSAPATAHPPYADLLPERVLDAVEAAGHLPDGRMLALNSYENRVYQIGLEGDQWLVAKFYRPARWSDAQILEEHAFAMELHQHEVPVIPPLADPDGRTLHHHQGFRFALFPRRGGRWPELEDPEVRLRIGRFLGRLHALGAVRPFQWRPAVDIEEFGEAPRRLLLSGDLIPSALRGEYETLSAEILLRVRDAFANVAPPQQRLHGDFHPGNLLWTDSGAHIVDLDDCRMGPVMQDLWLLLSGDRREMNEQLADLLEGYEEFADFPRRQLVLVEPLRALRLIHYAAWLARRWSDPAFPLHFPWFATPHYWEEQIHTLREQRQRLAELD